jgi:DNA-binding winged helix-turn-helix (wHTH) protein
MAALFVFDPFELDPNRRRLTKAGEPVAVSDRQIAVLLRLVAHAGQIVAKDDLIEAAWKDVAVADNSLEQAISTLRRILGTPPDGGTYIATVPRQGYRFGVAVQRRAQRETDAGLDALLAPHRAFVEGRAALETLEGDQVTRALQVFEGALATVPEYASAHVGLANACMMRFEMTRADSTPDAAARSRAAHHAREACRLDPRSAEAWATLGFVLAGIGERVDAIAAATRAVQLEPDNWRHQFRLAYVSWGEQRLQAAHRALALLPDFPLAHWLAATVHVARQVLEEAERELVAGVGSAAGGRFGGVALHWLLGLIHLARGDDARALEEFERELSAENSGHLYARECCANTWYAIGALRLRQGRTGDAVDAFNRTLERVAMHPMAYVGLAWGNRGQTPPPRQLNAGAPLVDAAFVQAAAMAARGAHADAARTVAAALAAAPAGNAGWVLPVEPLLHVSARPDAWGGALAYLRNRAA